MQKNKQFIVGIGASAGGLAVLKELVTNLPKKSGISYIIVQHLDPTHESMLTELLGKVSSLPVEEATDKQLVKPDHIYVIPPDAYLEINKNKIKLIKPEHQRGMRKAVDHLFRSLAKECGPYCAGVILSGAGSDGTAGLRVIKAAGGLALAQDPNTAEHDSMPLSAIDAGIIDKTLSISEMPDVLNQYQEYAKTHDLIAEEEEKESEQASREQNSEVPEDLNDLSALLETHENFSLKQYKHGTVSRRIARRMNLINIEEYDAYVNHLRTNEVERKQLTRDLLINVTDFFRDPEAFEELGNQVVIDLIKNVKSDEDVRIWVAGCATGEEAYSLAILMLNQLKSVRKRNHVKIFATDIDEEAIQIARKGVYPISIAGEVPPEYLEKYFNKLDNDHYQIKQRVRDTISFATQNLSVDPPFSRMNLISCRNLLIYLKKDVQEKILRSFYFALQDDGSLLLGSSETLGSQSELFKTLSKKWRLYKKIPGHHNRQELFKHLTSKMNKPVVKSKNRDKSTPTRSDKMQQALVKAVMPASVIISNDGGILFRYGYLNPYLLIPEGEPKNDFLHMVPTSIRSRMRSSLFKARKEHTCVCFNAPLALKTKDEAEECIITITPVDDEELGIEGAMAISFEKCDTPSAVSTFTPSKEEADHVQKLESELAETKEELQNTIEELETSTEELKASHEETLSTNEELQSSNEELEASSEELRSLNEELSTVNSQLKDKIEQLQRANDDVENLIASTDIATIFLDIDLKIQRYTPAAEKLLKMGPRDIDRPISSLGRDLVDDSLTEEAKSVLDSFKSTRKEVKDYQGRWFIRQLTPYRTEDRRIEGVVITFHDINEIKQLSERAQIREHQQVIVAKLGMLALNDASIDNLMHQTVRQVAHVFDADYCKVLRYQPEENNLLMVAGVGWNGDLVGKATVTDDLNSQAGYTLSVSEPVIVDNLKNEKRFQGPQLLSDHHVISGMSCLINHQNPPYGVIGVHTKTQRQFNEDDANFLLAIANLLSSAVKNKAAQEQMEESEKRFSIARDAASLGIHDWDVTNNTVKWDQRVRDIWGVSDDEAITFDTFIGGVHPGDLSATQAAVDSAFDPEGEGYYEAEYRVIHRLTKATTWVLATGKVFFQEGKPVRLVGTVADINASKLAEAALNDARQKAEQASDAKSEFLALMSHEIRTPLNAVVGISKILKTMPSLPAEKKGEMYNTLHTSADSLLGLINDLLDISKIESGTLVLESEPFNLGHVITEIDKMTEARLQKGVKLKTAISDIEGKEYVGDKQRIRQVILNLATNAAKFTKKGSILISAQADKKAGCIRVIVKDTGIGIPESQQDEIFNKFTQTDVGSAREYEGTGLGLAIVKSLVTAMGGDISLRSEIGEGSQFTLMLPLPHAKQHGFVKENEAVEKTTGKGKNLLLVEDNEANVLVATTMIQEMGYHIEVMRDGKAALAEMEKKRGRYCGILLDIRMPGLDGYEVMKRLRSTERAKKLPPIPIIAITANALSGDKKKCIDAGATDYLAKPFKPKELQKILQIHCV